MCDAIRVLETNNENISERVLPHFAAAGVIALCAINPFTNSIVPSVPENTVSIHSSYIANGIVFKQKREENINVYENITIPSLPLREENLERLQQISELENDWDGEGAQTIDKDLIKTVVNLIGKLRFQPQIFPTACDSIQLEYDKTNGDYLEFEVSQGSTRMFYLGHNGEHYEREIDIELVGKMVLDFYGTDI